MEKILTITLNPAIDVRYNIEDFYPGNVHRTISIEKNAGGKGINVSRIINLLGGDILATGIIGGYTGKLFLEKLNNDLISNDFLETNYETRTCIAIISNSTTNITEILESGIGDSFVYEEFIKKYTAILENNNIKVICGSGSILKNINPMIYNTLVNEANKRNIKFILDTSGNTLINALDSQPFLIKPNKEELEDIFNKKLNTTQEIILAGKELLNRGVKNVMITLGKDGALLINQDGVLKATLPKVEIKNTVGSGDSTIGGFSYALSQHKEISECFKLGIACGTTNAMLDSTGFIEISLLNSILPKIKIEYIEKF